MTENDFDSCDGALALIGGRELEGPAAFEFEYWGPPEEDCRRGDGVVGIEGEVKYKGVTDEGVVKEEDWAV